MDKYFILIDNNGCQVQVISRPGMCDSDHCWYPAPEGFVPDSDICYIENNQIKIAKDEVANSIKKQRKYLEKLDSGGFSTFFDAVAPLKTIEFLHEVQLPLTSKNKLKQLGCACCDEFLNNGFVWVKDGFKFVIEASMQQVTIFDVNILSHNTSKKELMYYNIPCRNSEGEKTSVQLNLEEYKSLAVQLRKYVYSANDEKAKMLQEVDSIKSLKELSQIREIDFAAIDSLISHGFVAGYWAKKWGQMVNYVATPIEDKNVYGAM